MPDQPDTEGFTVTLDHARKIRDRELLNEVERWTPRQALEAALLDIELGNLKPEGLVIFYGEPDPMNDPESSIGRYVGSDGVRGKKDQLWMRGMVARALHYFLG